MTIERAAKPDGSNEDEWLSFLEEYLDNRPNCPTGIAYVAMQISEAIDEAQERGRQLYILRYGTNK